MTSIKVKLNPFCHPITTYTVQVLFGVRQEGGNVTCPPEQSIIATIVPGEFVIFSVNTTALMLEDDQEYCFTNASLTGEPGTWEYTVHIHVWDSWLTTKGL